MPIEFDNKMPIYIQILNQIKKDIIAGKIKAGEKLLSVREMADVYKVNPNTMQRVYQLLEAENITITQRGMGSYITTDEALIQDLKAQRANEEIENFTKEMNALGYEHNEIVHLVKNYFDGGLKE